MFKEHKTTRWRTCLTASSSLSRSCCRLASLCWLAAEVHKENKQMSHEENHCDTIINCGCFKKLFKNEQTNRVTFTTLIYGCKPLEPQEAQRSQQQMHTQDLRHKMERLHNKQGGQKMVELAPHPNQHLQKKTPMSGTWHETPCGQASVPSHQMGTSRMKEKRATQDD